MSQTQRDRLAAVIRGWNGAARSLEAHPAATAACEQLGETLLAHLQRHTTMSGLAEAYLVDNGNWPLELPKPVGATGGVRVEVVVAATYWRRYRQLIDQATAVETRPAPASAPQPATEPEDTAPKLSPVDISYTIKLWQRGPLRLRAIPIDLQARYQALIEEAYQRIVDCQDVYSLAARYYGDGEWVLQIAQERLPKLGERPSTIGWAQDAACWRRYLELAHREIERQENERCHPRFALWLAQQMARRHLNVPDLARRLSVESSVVRSWLGGTAMPGSEHGPQLAALFGVSEGQWPRIAEAAMA